MKRFPVIAIQILLAAALGLALVCAVFWFTLSRVFFRDHSNDRIFDRHTWLSAKGEIASGHRGEMIGDLRRNHLRVGMSKRQITDMLGQPDKYKCQARYTYYLGSRSGDMLCPDFLEISFDKRRRVSRTVVREM